MWKVESTRFVEAAETIVALFDWMWWCDELWESRLVIYGIKIHNFCWFEPSFIFGGGIIKPQNNEGQCKGLFG